MSKFVSEDVIDETGLRRRDEVERLVMKSLTPTEYTKPEIKAEARAAGLRYSSDEQPGWTRRRVGDHFEFYDKQGQPITNADEVSRIRKLAIPPAYEDVWICPQANGHLQASGRDAKGRKQYRYHELWREHRDAGKFHRMLAFGRLIPKIRNRVNRDLERRRLDQRKVLAAVVRLLEISLIRVGNEEYVRQNKSYGLTTLRNRHVRIKGRHIIFDFRGKSGKQHHIDIEDRRLARVIRRCQELPGQDLFEYLDSSNVPRRIASNDVNDYLHKITGGDYTAKDFRTWIATVLAAIALQEFDRVTSPSEAKRNMKAVFESVSKVLGNTPTICRKSYVHPEIMHAYFEGSTIADVTKKIQERLAGPMNTLQKAEAAVLALLERRLKQPGRPRKKS